MTPQRIRGAFGDPREDGTMHGAALCRREALLVPRRYTPGRKRQLLAAVAAGVVSFDEVAAAHRIHPEEWAMWQAGSRQQRRRVGRGAGRATAAEAAP